MAKYNSKFNMGLALFIVILLVISLISACNILGDRDTAPGPPSSTAGILTPVDNTKVSINGPVQIQSVVENSEAISRVELWVKGERDERAKLIRSNRPAGSTVLQEWVPLEPGQYLITVRTYSPDDNQNPQSEDAVRLNVVDNPITVPNGEVRDVAELRGPQQAATSVPATPLPTPPPTGEGAAGFRPPAQSAEEQAVIQVVATSTPLPSPTPIRRYPPPPPAPGVPPGPTQAQQPKLFPPACDAAEVLGPYVPSPQERVVITEEDDVPAKTVGGTKVFRAWRVRNVGTCTWGPGYELAFYGGRAMGAGGVPFEGLFGPEPERANEPRGEGRVWPEGKPNQVAVLELLLNVPVTPGIHQSYWRMRNPQGVYFGPIMGVTLEVVRECDFGIYGAPVVNQFEIIAAGQVYRPTDPTRATVERGEAVTIQWDVINADNYDILVRGPTGGVDNLRTGSFSDRRSFIPQRLGEYTVTLVADNGSCTASAEVSIDVVPNPDEPFTLDIVPISSADDIKAQWRHPDPQANRFPLWAQPVQFASEPQCFGTDCTEGWWGDWSGVCKTVFCRDSQAWQATGPVQEVITGATAQGEARVTGVASQLCPETTPSGTKFGIRYFMTAEKDDATASPAKSNVVIVECNGGALSPTPRAQGTRLPDEIPSE